MRERRSRGVAFLVACLLWGSLARAGTPVVSIRGPEKGVERVQSCLGSGIGGLEAVDLEALLAERPPGLFGGARLACDGPSTPAATFGPMLTLVERSIDQGAYPMAAATLGTVIERAGCVAEGVDPALLARIYLLRARLHAGLGHEAAVTADVRTALRFDPALSRQGADGFPAQLRPALDAAVRAEPPAGPTLALQLLPERRGKIGIDGAEHRLKDGRVTLSAGLHLLRIPGASPETLLIDVREPGEATLVMPRALSGDVVRWAKEGEEEREALGQVLELAFGPDREVVVDAGPRLYKVHTSSGRWELLPALDPRGPSLMKSGAAVLISGLVLAGATYAVGSIMVAQCEDAIADGDPVSGCGGDREGQYNVLRFGLPVLEGVATVGAVGLGIGFVLDRKYNAPIRRARRQAEAAARAHAGPVTGVAGTSAAGMAGTSAAGEGR